MAAKKEPTTPPKKKSSNKNTVAEYNNADINKTNENEEWEEPAPEDPNALVNQLGVANLKEILFDKDGHLFSAAGRQSPVAEITSSGVMLHPPQKPYEAKGKIENITVAVNEKGIVLDELGQPRKIAGAKFKGQEIYWLGEVMPGTVKHYAGWFDNLGKAHKLYLQNQALTTDIIYKIRNRSVDGELSVFAELSTDE